jgi:hypothetical protein
LSGGDPFFLSFTKFPKSNEYNKRDNNDAKNKKAKLPINDKMFIEIQNEIISS